LICEEGCLVGERITSLHDQWSISPSASRTDSALEGARSIFPSLKRVDRMSRSYRWSALRIRRQRAI
jgi:hypothetical protein